MHLTLMAENCVELTRTRPSRPLPKHDGFLSQVIDGASVGVLDQQHAAKSEALSYYAELESILRAAAAQVNDFNEQQDLRQAMHQLQQQLQVRIGVTSTEACLARYQKHPHACQRLL